MAEIIIAHLYPELMDLYGDIGNLICLNKRIEWYGHKCTIVNIHLNSTFDLSEFDMLFMGSGSEREQDLVYDDLLKKADSLRVGIENGLPALFISGAYQLLGTTYQLPTGKIKHRLSILNFYTKAMDNRLTGNILIKADIDNTPVDVVGFENHAGRTFFVDENLEPFGKVVKGYGNNGEDGTEGIRYKNLIGTYLHGPLLPKNPIIADFFIYKILERKNIENHTKLNDDMEMFAHNQIKKRLLSS